VCLPETNIHVCGSSQLLAEAYSEARFEQIFSLMKLYKYTQQIRPSDENVGQFFD
jgi:CobQ-like glutamine amidotransferase family enzyme